MYDNTIPIFVSTDLNRTVEFYNKLDFVVHAQHPDYLIIESGDSSIHFSLVNSINKKKNYCACYYAVNNIAEFYNRCNELGFVHPNGHLRNESWGKEFAIIDPDWNLIKVIEKRANGST